MPVTSYSTTASENSDQGFAENQAPGSLNDGIRQVLADIAVEAQVNAVKVLASVAGTNTITGSMTPDLDAYSAGMLVVLTPANTTTAAAVTLNVDSLGALDVLRYGGEALQIGDLVSGVPAYLLLDSGSDDFYLLNPQNTGFRTVPQTAQGTYTYALTDSGKNVSPNATGLTHTIPTNASVAFPLGAVIVAFNNSGGNLTIAPDTGVTLYLAGTTSTGSRTLSHRGLATLMKLATDIWVVSGSGLS
jgi:hypothetical protein